MGRSKQDWDNRWAYIDYFQLVSEPRSRYGTRYIRRRDKHGLPHLDPMPLPMDLLQRRMRDVEQH